MPTTPNRALRYPQLTDAPNVPQAVQDLASDVDTILGADSGWITLVLNSGGVAGTWTATPGYVLAYRKIGVRVEIRGMATWSTALLTNVITTMPAGARPPVSSWIGTSIGAGTTVIAQILVEASGVVSIPSATYYTGTPSAPSPFRVAGSYLTT